MPRGDQYERRRVEVTGIVQGIGFRPYVFALARELRLTGLVRNHAAGVTIEVEGAAEWLAAFTARLPVERPPMARIDKMVVESIAVEGSRRFLIVESAGELNVSTPIPPDVCVCDECLAEMRNPADRRFEYPFINCTNCGPRFTIIRDIPYDRPQTTMASFVMCPQCEAEYRDSSSRRFHAQPNACPLCGPSVWFVSREMLGNDDDSIDSAGSCPRNNDALHAFEIAIQRELIVAVKGVGGFHLACDATSDLAISRLRERKGRVDKPFAIMVADLQAANRIAVISPDERRLLTSRERPIVLLKLRPSSDALSSLVAPGNDYVGVMLPYSPLHYMLTARHGLLVMTSGNLSEEPIVRTNREARTRLAGLADAFLLHDREIHVVCDDSVVRVFAARELPIRRSRGYAPMPVLLTREGPSVLAVGGELKAVFCVTKGRYAYCSQHIGDMANLETLQAFDRGVRHYCDLFRVQPEVVACDTHPGYLSTRWARTFAEEAGVPIQPVQHHHAHIAALRTEHQCHDPVIGVCFDGTGYGPDGAIWGGEVLVVTDDGFERSAHLRYVPLPGGDASIKRPYRAALAHAWAAGIPWTDDLPCVQACPADERSLLLKQLQRNVNCVPTSSMGRLFDAVASLIGQRHIVSYEAQAAMELEAISTMEDELDAYHFRCDNAFPMLVQPKPVLAAIVQDIRQGAPRSVIAGRFHAGLGHLVRELCLRVRDRQGVGTVALSGGVFQNVLLLGLVVDLLEQAGFRVLVHHQTPPNDGGIALGQAAIARGGRS